MPKTYHILQVTNHCLLAVIKRRQETDPRQKRRRTHTLIASGLQITAAVVTMQWHAVGENNRVYTTVSSKPHQCVLRRTQRHLFRACVSNNLHYRCISLFTYACSIVCGNRLNPFNIYSRLVIETYKSRRTGVQFGLLRRNTFAVNSAAVSTKPSVQEENKK